MNELQYKYMAIINKRAKFNYKLEGDKYEAGVSLLGIEAKTIRGGRGDLSNAIAKIHEGEAWLINANIPASQPPLNYNSTRSRKLLLHKHELVSISTKMKQQKLTLVPVKMYNKGRLIKIELVLGKPKRKFEKRQTIKKKDIEREIEQELKNRRT